MAAGLNLPLLRPYIHSPPRAAAPRAVRTHAHPCHGEPGWMATTGRDGDSSGEGVVVWGCAANHLNAVAANHHVTSGQDSRLAPHARLGGAAAGWRGMAAGIRPPLLRPYIRLLAPPRRLIASHLIASRLTKPWNAVQSSTITRSDSA